MRARPVSPATLVDELADRIAAAPATPWTRVIIDGGPAPWHDTSAPQPGGEPFAGAANLADALVAPLRVRGREVMRVSAGDFLRPASLRLEFGRTNPDVFYDAWLDIGALIREVLGPLAPGGSGRVLPGLWNRAADRAFRRPYVTLPPGGVLLLDGALLLGRGLPYELAVHLWLSRGALARRTPEAERWTLPAYARYEEEVVPARVADIAVRADDPARPALVETPP